MSNTSFEFLIESKLDSSEIRNADADLEFDWFLDSIVGVFSIITNVLYANDVRFVLKINGRTYPTFETEFSIFLEYLSDIIDFACGEDIQSYNFDFYEQGISYSFILKKVDRTCYELEFLDRENPEGTQTHIGRFKELYLLSSVFFNQFIFLASKYCPAISKNDLFVEWKTRLSSKLSQT